MSTLLSLLGKDLPDGPGEGRRPQRPNPTACPRSASAPDQTALAFVREKPGFTPLPGSPGFREDGSCRGSGPRRDSGARAGLRWDDTFVAYKRGVTTSGRHGGFHELTPNVSPAVADGSGTTAGHRALEGNGLGVCYFVHPSFKPAARVGPGRAVLGPQASEAAPCHPTPAAPTAGSLAQDVGWGKGP